MILRHQGIDQQVGLSPAHDPWFWRLQTQQDRAVFWREVHVWSCIVIDGLNDAVLGLLYSRGRAVVVYDAGLATKLQRGAWQASSPRYDSGLSAVQQQSLSSWLDHDLGPQAPAWFLERF